MLRARKRFGQNFLVDQGIIRKIAGSLNLKPDDHVIEIGPGRGALTQSLVDYKSHLRLIEIDRDLAAELAVRFPDTDIITQDVMTVDFNELANSSPLRIVGNLPYNISTPLLFKLFDYGNNIADMHFMLQREVVDRMTSEPSTKSYGRLSVMTQLHCDTEKLFEVPPEAFSPRPKVQSAVVRLTPNNLATGVDKHLLETILIQAFSQRRKTIRNALGKFLTAEDLESIGLDPRLRPENLTIDDYLSCTRYVGARP